MYLQTTTGTTGNAADAHDVSRVCRDSGITLKNIVEVVSHVSRKLAGSGICGSLWRRLLAASQDLSVRSALVELYLEGGEEAQDAAWAALLAAEAFCRPNKLAALTELTRRLANGTHTAKVRAESQPGARVILRLTSAVVGQWQACRAREA